MCKKDCHSPLHYLTKLFEPVSHASDATDLANTSFAHTSGKIFSLVCLAVFEVPAQVLNIKMLLRSSPFSLRPTFKKRLNNATSDEYTVSSGN